MEHHQFAAPFAAKNGNGACLSGVRGRFEDVSPALSFCKWKKRIWI